MRILKILLISTALAAFGVATALAQPAQYAAKTGETTVKSKKTKKYAAKKTVKKKAVKAKKKSSKKVHAAKTKRKPAPSTETEAAPGNPPPGSSTN
jgi:hypothetical protein